MIKQHFVKFTICFAALAAVAHAATVDFSNFPTSGGNANPDSVTSGGATFNGDTLVVANPTAPPFDKLGTAISNNTTYLMVNPSGVTMTLGGYGTTSAPAPFDLTSIDLNRVFFDDLAGNAAGLPNALIVNVTGTTVSGSTVRTNIRVDGSKNFQTFSLPSNFVNLMSVRFTSNNDGSVGPGATENAVFSLDNVVYNPSAGCTFKLDSGGQYYPYTGANGSIVVTASDPLCPWNITSPPFILPGTNAIGSGTYTFQVPFNKGDLRSGNITIGGVPYLVEQGSAFLPSPKGDLAHFATGAGWKTRFTAVNFGTGRTLARLDFTDDNGNPVTLPLTFPQTATPAAGPLLAPTIDRSLPPNAQVIWDIANNGATTAQTGSTHLSSSGNYNGFITISHEALGWSSLVPLDKNSSSSQILVFDNTGVIRTGVAITTEQLPLSSSGLTANVSARANVIASPVTVTIYDDTGAQIGTGTLALAASGHTSFMLDDLYPVVIGKRGWVRFAAADGFSLSIVGLRGNGGGLTTLPQLNDTGAGGGSISHFTFNAGFTSTLYILNPATTPASFSLNFYDDTGAPLSVPLLLPQTGTNLTTDSLVQAMAPGTVLVVQTRANDKLASVSASAQLVSGGNVTAFEVFKWTTTGQEASVPLETRNAGGFVLLYDNTGSRTTGVAVAAFGSGPATIPVVIRDDAGNILRNDTITLPAHGHTAFLLPSTYPETARKRGMVEFIINPGVKASVIGLQAKSDGSLTTVPALTR